MAFAFIKNLFHHKAASPTDTSSFDSTAGNFLMSAAQSALDADTYAPSSSGNSLPALPSFNFTPAANLPAQNTPAVPAQGNFLSSIPKPVLYGGAALAGGFILYKLLKK